MWLASSTKLAHALWACCNSLPFLCSCLDQLHVRCVPHLLPRFNHCLMNGGVKHTQVRVYTCLTMVTSVMMLINTSPSSHSAPISLCVLLYPSPCLHGVYSWTEGMEVSSTHRYVRQRVGVRRCSHMTYTILSCTNIVGGSYDNYQLIIAYSIFRFRRFTKWYRI